MHIGACERKAKSEKRKAKSERRKTKDERQKTKDERRKTKESRFSTALRDPLTRSLPRVSARRASLAAVCIVCLPASDPSGLLCPSGYVRVPQPFHSRADSRAAWVRSLCQTFDFIPVDDALPRWFSEFPDIAHCLAVHRAENGTLCVLDAPSKKISRPMTPFKFRCLDVNIRYSSRRVAFLKKRNGGGQPCSFKTVERLGAVARSPPAPLPPSRNRAQSLP